MAATAVDSATFDDFGFHRDRRWMLVDSTGKFLTQRTHHRMAVMTPTLTNEGLSITAPSMPPLRVSIPDGGAEQMKVSVWGDEVDATRSSVEADQWCSDFLGLACHLVYMADDTFRPVKPRHAPNGERVHFGDRFPLLVIGEGSLADLNHKLTSAGKPPVPMDRFRPNIVIGSREPFAEDRWTAIRIGDGASATEIRMVKPCGRCVMTTVDQRAGVSRGPEPLLTLSTYRRQWRNVMFGQNAIHHTIGTTIRLGDAVTVLGYKRPGSTETTANADGEVTTNDRA